MGHWTSDRSQLHGTKVLVKSLQLAVGESLFLSFSQHAVRPKTRPTRSHVPQQFAEAQRFNSSLPWNVSRVTSMVATFSYVKTCCVKASRSRLLGHLNALTFGYTSCLLLHQIAPLFSRRSATLFASDISAWDTSSCTDMNSMVSYL
jgi:Mycoplasma protein of unknown function, DUF285